MNPYATFLADQEPLAVIADTPRLLREWAERFGAHVNSHPAPGQWSLREVLCHLADTEIVFAFRLRQALSQENHVIQPYDQNGWAKDYAAYSVSEALDTFAAVRLWNRRLLKDVTPEMRARVLSHPERGAMTFQTLLETMGGHDLNHIAQIERLAASLGVR